MSANTTDKVGGSLILDLDKVFGLKLADAKKEDVEISEDAQMLVCEREHARKNKDWVSADELREEIEKKGFYLEDSNGLEKSKVF